MPKIVVGIAEAKLHFSELINKVEYAHEEIIITKRGKPIAVISAPSEKKGLASAKGWLDKNDSFFDVISNKVKKRQDRGLKVEVRQG